VTSLEVLPLSCQGMGPSLRTKTCATASGQEAHASVVGGTPESPQWRPDDTSRSTLD